MKKLLIIIPTLTLIAIGAEVYMIGLPKIFDELSRTYRNFTNGGIMDLRRQSIDNFAGCNGKSMMELSNDQGMTNIWPEESQKYHFDAIDVDRYMMNNCPSSTSEEVREGRKKYYVWLNKELKKNGKPEISQEEQDKNITWAIQKEIAVSAYQKKFLNREFTTLKNEPKD